jgi:hemerythrin superfamily protein
MKARDCSRYQYLHDEHSICARSPSIDTNAQLTLNQFHPAISNLVENIKLQEPEPMIQEIDAVKLLISQHRSMEEMLEKVMKETGEEKRKSLFAEAGDQLTVHIKSEEDIFYPAVKAARTEDILLESLEEHLSLKRLLADLLALDPSEKAFEPKFKVLKEQTEHHHKEEEEHLFPKVNKLLDQPRREELGKQMLKMQMAMKKQGEPREGVVNETASAAPLE